MDSNQRKPKKRHNACEKLTLRAEQFRLFAQQAGRKAQKRIEPNDRQYVRDVERLAKRMKPGDVDRLLRDGDDD